MGLRFRLLFTSKYEKSEYILGQTAPMTLIGREALRCVFENALGVLQLLIDQLTHLDFVYLYLLFLSNFHPSDNLLWALYVSTLFLAPEILNMHGDKLVLENNTYTCKN